MTLYRMLPGAGKECVKFLFSKCGRMLRGTVVIFQLSSGCFQATCDLGRRRFGADAAKNGEAVIFKFDDYSKPINTVSQTHH